MKSLFWLFWIPLLAGWTMLLDSGCAPVHPESKAGSEYQWIKLSDTAEWPKSYNYSHDVWEMKKAKAEAKAKEKE